ncbi:hypothetical protein TRSC58_00901 [Trypanosoma rangeli SC58]|uniref:ERGIC and golgi family 3 n=1 Tax=Trypanosoma rangeli SC58 TaxID=429131 RepID=A0A061JAG3_TRYRA|nr:hypothetical protein TRSC58_00901 [Trypanosoma rangeli SC58]
MSVLRQRSLLVAEKPLQMPLLKKVAAVDLFPKPKDDYSRAQTHRGALVSLATVIVIGLLVFWEVGSYITGRDAYKTELSVDTSVATEVDFNLDITFPKVPCHEISLDVLDVTGTFKFNVTRNILKTPMDEKGNPAFFGHRHSVGQYGVFHYEAKGDPNSPKFCGRCLFGKDYKDIGNGQKPCCNTCDEVMKAHDQHDLPRPPKTEVEQCIYELSRINPGCNYKGTLRLRKVSGSLFFAPKRVGGGFLIHDVMQFDPSHIINKLTIGDERVTRFSRRGVHYPLNGHEFDTQGRFSEIRYFLKVVPTMYLSWKNAGLNETYEYGVQWDHRFIPIGFGQLPSVSFGFEFHPIQVNNYFKRPSFPHFFGATFAALLVDFLLFLV